MFKENLIILRKSADLTQKDVAKILSVSDKTISHWEKGVSEPSLDQLRSLRDIFGASYEDILDE